ncbi:MAG: ATP-grasp domain-containing protein [Blastocatellia bacterium]|nr:ATP-grasp domain-containing protein [Blastocatellia bacterium]
MKTLILSPRYTPDSIALAGAAVEAGWNVERFLSWRVPQHFSGVEPVLYGESLFVAAIAEQLSLTLVAPPLDWLARLPVELCKRKVEFSTLGQAKAGCFPAFVKPADEKCFPARVYETGEHLAVAALVEDETPVLVAEPVEWDIEFRCFVCHGEVMTLSPYSRHGVLLQTETGEWPASETEWQSAGEFARLVLGQTESPLPVAAVLDVGFLPERGWAVVEANPAWGSGIYGCDPVLVLETLAASVM